MLEQSTEMDKGNRIRVSVFLDAKQKGQLDELSKITRVPVATYIREGVDMVLKRYRTHLEEPKS